MAPRYEYADTGTEVGVYSPYDADEWHDFDDEDFPREQAIEDGTHVLVIGNPYASAYAIFGTLDQLDAFVGRLRGYVAAARHQRGLS